MWNTGRLRTARTSMPSRLIWITCTTRPSGACCRTDCPFLGNLYWGNSSVLIRERFSFGGATANNQSLDAHARKGAMSSCGPSHYFAAAPRLGGFRSEADINSGRWATRHLGRRPFNHPADAVVVRGPPRWDQLQAQPVRMVEVPAADQARAVDQVYLQRPLERKPVIAHRDLTVRCHEIRDSATSIATEAIHGDTAKTRATVGSARPGAARSGRARRCG